MPTFGLAAYAGRVRRAKLFKNWSMALEDTPSFWCGLGRQTEWLDDNLPPEPSPSAVDIEEPIVFFKADLVTLCAWSENEADVVVYGNNFEFVSDGEADEKAARWVYLQFTMDGTIEGIPTGTFRQVGVFSDLVPATGHENDEWLAPAHVEDVGTLEYISNRGPVVFSDNEVRIERTVIEFK